MINTFAQASAERLHESVFHKLPDAALLCDADGRILDLNPAACRLFSGEPESMLGRFIFELFPATELESFRKLLQRASHDEPAVSAEFSLGTSGRCLPVELTAGWIEMRQSVSRSIGSTALSFGSTDAATSPTA